MHEADATKADAIQGANLALDTRENQCRANVLATCEAWEHTIAEVVSRRRRLVKLGEVAHGQELHLRYPHLGGHEV